MNKEELAVVIYEECSSKTRSTKECVEAIKLRTGLNLDIDDTIRRYRQSGSGLEKAANEILVSVSPTEYRLAEGVTVQPLVTVTNSNFDTYVTLFNQKGFIEAEGAARICTLLEKKGTAFDVHTVEEHLDENYRNLTGVKIGECLYFLDSLEGMRESAVENRAESISYNAWDMARDEINDMDTWELLEYAGWYDGVKSYDSTDDSDELLIELDA
jgi:hypothetical protein